MNLLSLLHQQYCLGKKSICTVHFSFQSKMVEARLEAPVFRLFYVFLDKCLSTTSRYVLLYLVPNH